MNTSYELLQEALVLDLSPDDTSMASTGFLLSTTDQTHSGSLEEEVKLLELQVKL